MRPDEPAQVRGTHVFTLSPDQKGIETSETVRMTSPSGFTLSPDQKGIETSNR